MPSIEFAFGRGLSWHFGPMGRHGPTGTIPDWNIASGTILAEFGTEIFVYTSIDYGSQINIGVQDGIPFGVSPLPTGGAFQDTPAIGLANPTDMLKLTVAGSTFLVVASAGEDAITTLQMATGGPDVGTLSFVTSAYDPDAADPRAPLDGVRDLASLTIGGTTFVAAQSQVYGDLSLWRMDAGGQLTMTDHLGGFQSPGNPTPSLRQVAAVGGQNFGIVVGADFTGALALYEARKDGTLTLIDTSPDPDNQPLAALEVVSFGGRTFAYSGMTSGGTIWMNEILPDGFGPSVALTGAGQSVVDLKAVNVNGAEVLLACDANQNRVHLYVVQPDGGLQEMGRVTVSGGLASLTSADLIVARGTGDADVLMLAATVGFGFSNDGATELFEIDTDFPDLTGTSRSDVLVGAALSDSFVGGKGGDWLFGGADVDTLRGGLGDDTVMGGRGADVLRGDDGVDLLDYHLSEFGVTVNLETGAAAGGDATGDSFRSFENLRGSGLDDTLTGGGSANFLFGDGGADTIYGGGGDDTIYGGFTSTDNADDTVFGGRGDDRILGRFGDELFRGGAGNDTLKVSGARVNGDLRGDAGDDNLEGDRGDDRLYGGADDDRLSAGGGSNTLTGGAGSDAFEFSATAPGHTRITDFLSGTDHVELSGFGYASGTAVLADLTAVASGTKLTLGPDYTIIFEGLAPGGFSGSDFLV